MEKKDRWELINELTEGESSDGTVLRELLKEMDQLSDESDALYVQKVEIQKQITRKEYRLALLHNHLNALVDLMGEDRGFEITTEG